LPQPYRDKIEFDEPKTLEDTIQKERYCYEQFKNKTEPHKDWKKKNNSGFKKKGFKPSRFKNHGKISRMRVLNYNYTDLRLPVRLVVEDRKGSGVVEGLLSREGAHFLGGTDMWGMRDCRLLVELAPMIESFLLSMHH
jgi:hypothetical protein